MAASPLQRRGESVLDGRAPIRCLLNSFYLVEETFKYCTNALLFLNLQRVKAIIMQFEFTYLFTRLSLNSEVICG